jgi:hypothetical protein
MSRSTEVDLNKLAENLLVFDQLMAKAEATGFGGGSTQRIEICDVIDNGNIVKSASAIILPSGEYEIVVDANGTPAIFEDAKLPLDGVTDTILQPTDANGGSNGIGKYRRACSVPICWTIYTQSSCFEDYRLGSHYQLL